MNFIVLCIICIKNEDLFSSLLEQLLVENENKKKAYTSDVAEFDLVMQVYPDSS